MSRKGAAIAIAISLTVALLRLMRRARLILRLDRPAAAIATGGATEAIKGATAAAAIASPAVSVPDSECKGFVQPLLNLR
jgi:hypothetical protein